MQDSDDGGKLDRRKNENDLGTQAAMPAIVSCPSPSNSIYSKMKRCWGSGVTGLSCPLYSLMVFRSNALSATSPKRWQLRAL